MWMKFSWDFVLGGRKQPSLRYLHRADSRFASSQWETSLHSNAVSHWLGAKLESQHTAVWHNLFTIWYAGNFQASIICDPILINYRLQGIKRVGKLWEQSYRMTATAVMIMIIMIIITMIMLMMLLLLITITIIMTITLIIMITIII